MPVSDYDHWGEEAPIVWARENDFDSPMADMTDDEIKQAVYDRRDDYDGCSGCSNPYCDDCGGR